MSSSHPILPIEEDTIILHHAGLGGLLKPIVFVDPPEFDTSIFNERNQDFLYDFHETFLRMLNSVDAPRSHWLLKCCLHALCLDTLLRHYPHALLIMNHRRFDEVVPSYCHLVCKNWTNHLNETDSASRDIPMRQAIEAIDQMVRCIVEFHSRRCQQFDQSQKNIFHLAYNDLIEQPIATVRHLYDHFGLQWSDEFEAAMRAWLQENPQGKQGRHSYSLAEFGLTREDMETRYADYIKLFPCSSPLGSASSDENSSINTHVKSS
jgi:hypothetical protein